MPHLRLISVYPLSVFLTITEGQSVSIKIPLAYLLYYRASYNVQYLGKVPVGQVWTNILLVKSYITAFNAVDSHLIDAV